MEKLQGLSLMVESMLNGLVAMQVISYLLAVCVGFFLAYIYITSRYKLVKRRGKRRFWRIG